MQKTIRASVLVLALVVSSNAVYAGNMGNGTPEPTPPPPPTANRQTTADITPTDADMDDPVVDAATDIAMTLLQNLLALF